VTDYDRLHLLHIASSSLPGPLLLVLQEETIFISEKELHLKAQLPVSATFIVDGFQPCGNGSAG
jgi:hypothetical protein